MMLKQNRLGQTGIFISNIGLGTVKFGRNTGVKYPSTFSLPTDKEIQTLLAMAKDFGLNLIDTAPAYGFSEQRLGLALKKAKRTDWVIASKVGEEFENNQSYFDFSATHLTKSIQRSLKRLKTDYLDIVLVHSDGQDLERIDKDGVFDCLQHLKEQGLIRAYGMSSKTIEGGLKTIEMSDVAMVMYNPLEQKEKAIIDYAKQKQKGILIKKAFASGHLSKFNSATPVKDTLEFILKTEGVTSIITGTTNPKHLQETLEIASAL